MIYIFFVMGWFCHQELCILGGFCPTLLHVTSCPLVCCVKHNAINFSMVMINSSAETLTCM